MWALVLVVSAVAILAVVLARRVPLSDRIWADDLARLASAEMLPDGTIRMDDVRDWRYRGDSVVSRDYFGATYDPNAVTGLWFYEAPLDDRGLTAHTFLVFEFDESYGDHSRLAFSVEARREAGEEYSLLGGVLRKYEVAHVWASEEDVVTRRTEFYDTPVTRYSVIVEREHLSRIFRGFVERTIELDATPRWYNTLTTNCASLLVDYVNSAEPGAIPWNYSLILTGRADEYLARLGYLDVDEAKVFPPADVDSAPPRS